MSDCLYWIWCQNLFGIGTVRAHRVLEQYNDPASIFEKSREQLLADGFFTQSEIAAIIRHDLCKAIEQRDNAFSYGAKIVTPDSSDYPGMLAQIHSKPLVFYTTGDLSVLKGRYVITMVGTRHANDYGLRAAENLGSELGAAGAVVVSGLAPGLDAASLQGALDGGGKVVAVLGCGLDNPYPRSNEKLRRRIENNNGAVISEYPIGTPPMAHHFPIRNRIMSGLGMGVAVVQAPRKSGALITVRHAMDQGREVFAVPGEIYDPKMEGCNDLIKDGVKSIGCAMDILEEYIPVYGYPISPISRAVQNPKTVKVVSKAAKTEYNIIQMPEFRERIQAVVYAALSSGFESADAVAESTDEEISQVLAALTELEIMGLAEPLPGRRYRVRPDKKSD